MESRLVVARGWRVGEMGGGDRRVQTVSDNMSKFRTPTIQPCD